MNLSQRTSLALLLVSLGAGPATAAMSGDSVSDEMSIETNANNAALLPLDQLLGGGNNSDLFESILKQHASAGQPAISMMDGHFGSVGAEKPVVFGQQIPTDQTMPPAPITEPSKAPDLSLTAAVNMGGGKQADTGGAPVTSPTTSEKPRASIVTTDTTTPNPATPVAPVPLPAAGIMFASGIFGLPVVRRLRKV